MHDFEEKKTGELLPSSPVISPAPKCSSGTVTVCPRGVGFNQKYYTAALHLSQNVFHGTGWRISRLTRVLPRPSFGQEGGAFTHADGRRRRKKEGRGIFPRSHNGMDDDCSGGGRGRRRAVREETIVLQLGRGELFCRSCLVFVLQRRGQLLCTKVSFLMREGRGRRKQ